MRKQDGRNRTGRRLLAGMLCAAAVLSAGCQNLSPKNAGETAQEAETGSEAETGQKAESAQETESAQEAETESETESAQEAETGWALAFAELADRFTQGELEAVTLEEAMQTEGFEGMVSLGTDPEECFSLFGGYTQEMGAKGILIRDWEGNVNCFAQIEYSSPRGVLPRCAWEEEEGIFVAAFRTLTGSGMDADQCYAFLWWETGHLEATEIDRAKIEEQLEERIRFQAEEDSNTAVFGEGERELLRIPLGELNGSQIEAVFYTDQLHFMEDGTMSLTVTPGFQIAGMAPLQYAEAEGEIRADFGVQRTAGADGEDRITFTVGKIG